MATAIPILMQFGTQGLYTNLSGKRDVRGNRFSDGYALPKRVNLHPPFRISWAVWVKLGNYGFRGTPTGEWQTSPPKE